MINLLLKLCGVLFGILLVFAITILMIVIGAIVYGVLT